MHLTLTCPKPVHFPKNSLNSLAIKSYFGLLKKEDLVREIHSQIELFEKFFGSFPDYIDGHEFCHHLPRVRAVLAEVVEELNLKKGSFYVRVFSPGRLPFFKNSFFWIMNHLASWPSKKLKSILKTKNIPFNSRLLGFHPLPLEPERYFDYYFSAKPSQRDVFFCHPGLASKDQEDSLRDYRHKIYNFMMSSQFEDMLKHYQIQRTNRLSGFTKEKDVSILRESDSKS